MILCIPLNLQSATRPTGWKRSGASNLHWGLYCNIEKKKEKRRNNSSSKLRFFCTLVDFTYSPPLPFPTVDHRINCNINVHTCSKYHPFPHKLIAVENNQVKKKSLLLLISFQDVFIPFYILLFCSSCYTIFLPSIPVCYSLFFLWNAASSFPSLVFPIHIYTLLSIPLRLPILFCLLFLILIFCCSSRHSHRLLFKVLPSTYTL